MPTQPDSDPLLLFTSKPIDYIDVFVDNFLGLSQGYSKGWPIQRILLHAMDDVIRSLDVSNGPHCKKSVSLKELRQGDCSWSTIKTMLRWIVDTVNITIHLPPYWVERLANILASIPITQKRMSVCKWHKMLGKLWSMALALPGARHMFRHLQHALSTKLGGRVLLHKGVHHTLDNFR